MKQFKISILSALFLTFGATMFWSCSNEDEGQSSSAFVKREMSDWSEFLEIYNSIISLENTSDQKLAFAVLTPNERLGVMKLKFINFRDNNTLNEEQLAFVNEVYDLLRVELFTENHSERIHFIEEESENYMERSKSLFGEDEGWYLLAQVENINQRIDILNSGGVYNTSQSDGNPPISACDCAKSSECKRITGVAIGLRQFSLEWEYGTCPYGDCYVRSFFGLWESSNNGRCSY